MEYVDVLFSSINTFERVFGYYKYRNNNLGLINNEQIDEISFKEDKEAFEAKIEELINKYPENNNIQKNLMQSGM